MLVAFITFDILQN